MAPFLTDTPRAKSTLLLNLFLCNTLQDSAMTSDPNKTKVISADLLDLDFDFKDIIMFGNISVLVTFQFS